MPERQAVPSLSRPVGVAREHPPGNFPESRGACGFATEVPEIEPGEQLRVTVASDQFMVFRRGMKDECLPAKFPKNVTTQ